MTSKIYFTYDGIEHYGSDGKLKDTTYRYVAYPDEQTNPLIKDFLNGHFSSQEGAKTKKMIENLITWAFESFHGTKVQNITFDDRYKDKEFNTYIKNNFSCIIEYTSDK